MCAGYRLCQQIVKKLQTRSHAIRNTLNTYNAAVKALNCSQLEWDKVSHYQFLDDFELLKNTRADATKEMWARLPVQEMMCLGRQVARAAEEIDKVHAQACRVHTLIRDEDRLFTVVLDNLHRMKDPLHGAVLKHATRRRQAKTRILSHLKKLYRLPKYLGDTQPGAHTGAPFPAHLSPSELDVLTTSSGIQLLLDTGSDLQDTADVPLISDDEEDEDLQGELIAVTDFIATLAV